MINNYNNEIFIPNYDLTEDVGADAWNEVLSYLKPEQVAVFRVCSSKLKEIIDQFLYTNCYSRLESCIPLDRMIKASLGGKKIVVCLRSILDSSHYYGEKLKLSDNPMMSAIYAIATRILNEDANIEKTIYETLSSKNDIELSEEFISKRDNPNEDWSIYNWSVYEQRDKTATRKKNAHELTHQQKNLMNSLLELIQSKVEFTDLLHIAIQNNDEKILTWIAKYKASFAIKIISENNLLESICSNSIYFLRDLVKNQTNGTTVHQFQKELIPCLDPEIISEVFDHTVVSNFLDNQHYFELKSVLSFLPINRIKDTIYALSDKDNRQIIRSLKSLKTDEKLELINYLCSSGKIDLAWFSIEELKVDTVELNPQVFHLFKEYCYNKQLSKSLEVFDYLRCRNAFVEGGLVILLNSFFGDSSQDAIKLLKWLNNKNIYIHHFNIINEAIQASEFSTELNLYLDQSNSIEHLVSVIEGNDSLENKYKQMDQILNRYFSRSCTIEDMSNRLLVIEELISLNNIDPEFHSFINQSIFHFLNQNLLGLYDSELNKIKGIFLNISPNKISFQMFEAIEVSLKCMQELRKNRENYSIRLKQDKVQDFNFSQFVEIIREKIGEIKDFKQSLQWVNAINAAEHKFNEQSNEFNFIESIEWYLNNPAEAKKLLEETYIEVDMGIQDFDEVSEEFIIDEDEELMTDEEEEFIVEEDSEMSESESDIESF